MSFNIESRSVVPCLKKEDPIRTTGPLRILNLLNERIFPYQVSVDYKAMYANGLERLISDLIEQGYFVHLRGEPTVIHPDLLGRDPRQLILMKSSINEMFGQIEIFNRFYPKLTEEWRGVTGKDLWSKLQKQLCGMSLRALKRITDQVTTTFLDHVHATDLDFKTDAPIAVIEQAYLNFFPIIFTGNAAFSTKGTMFIPLTNQAMGQGFQIDLTRADHKPHIIRSHFSPEGLPGDTRGGPASLNLDRVRYEPHIDANGIEWFPIWETLPPVHTDPETGMKYVELHYPDEEVIETMTSSSLLLMAARALRESVISGARASEPQTFQKALSSAYEQANLLDEQQVRALVLDITSAFMVNPAQTLVWLLPQEIVDQIPQEILNDKFWQGRQLYGYGLAKIFNGLSALSEPESINSVVDMLVKIIAIQSLPAVDPDYRFGWVANVIRESIRNLSVPDKLEASRLKIDDLYVPPIINLLQLMEIKTENKDPFSAVCFSDQRLYWSISELYYRMQRYKKLADVPTSIGLQIIKTLNQLADALKSANFPESSMLESLTSILKFRMIQMCS